MSAPRPSEAGFTLVEALVSLFVFSLIAVGGVAMLMQSVDSQRRIGEAQTALRQLQTARALLAGDLSQVVSRSVRMPDNSRAPAFIGGDEAAPLAFVRAAAEPDPALGAATSLVYVQYLVRDGRLIRRSRSELDAIAQTPETERVLFEAGESVRFAFFDGAQWREQWVASGAGQPLPRAVALSAALPRYGEVRIETLVGAAR
jgi:general secretion pathway protein J